MQINEITMCGMFELLELHLPLGSQMVDQLQLPREFVVGSEVYAFSLNGRGVLECIPAGTVILASRRSTPKSMVEILWPDKPYVVFERDIRDRMQPLTKPEPEDDPLPGLVL